MSENQQPSLEEIPEKDYSLLVKQQLEYQHIRNQGSSTMQLILATISLIVSIGFIQFLLSGGAIRSVSLNIPDEAANQCSPEALTHSGLSLEGVGVLLSLTALGILGLSLYLLFESWLTNRVLQNRPISLHPRNEADKWISSYRDWIKWNQGMIAESRQLLVSIRWKLRYSAGLGVLALTLIGLLYLNQPIIIFVFGVVLVILGLGLVVEYVERYYWSSGPDSWGQVSRTLFYFSQILVSLVLLLGIVHIVGQLSLLQLIIISVFLIVFSIYLSDIDLWLDNECPVKIFGINEFMIGVFHFQDRHISLVFLGLSVLLLSFIINQYYKIYLLIDYLIIC